MNLIMQTLKLAVFLPSMQSTAKALASSPNLTESSAIRINESSNRTISPSIHIIHTFPKGTWIENLAVRPNGHILATEFTRPRIYQINPFTSQPPILIHEFSETASILGIVETSHDIFHVCSGNFSGPTLRGYGEAYIFKVDMRPFSPGISGSAQISKVATIPHAQALNGMAFLGDTNLLLVGDAILGAIWSVDIATGETRIAINSTYTRSTGFGINGLRIRRDTLYFTNTQQRTLVKVDINAKGEAVGPFTGLAQGGFEPDDFAIDERGGTYVASILEGRNGLVFVPREGGGARFVAEMKGPTACAFGRRVGGRGVLYVSTSGGDDAYTSGGPVNVRGKILSVDVEGMGYPFVAGAGF